MSELRQVCVLFINLSPQENLSRKSKLNMLQKAFEAIYLPLQKYEGSLNKVFMFDKVREVADSVKPISRLYKCQQSLADML